MSLPIFTTDRLSLRAFYPNDLHALHRLNSNPEVMAYIHAPETLEASRANLDRMIRYNAAHRQLGYWLCAERSSKNFIGWAALKYLDKSEEVEVGYRFLPEFWGKGYATEVSRFLIRYGFKELALPAICGVCMPENAASRRVLEKSGLSFKKDAIFYGVEVAYFSLDQKEWERVINQ